MPTTKKTEAKKKSAAGKTKKAMKGDKYACDVCGLVVSVDTVCGCIDTCNILCCNDFSIKKTLQQRILRPETPKILVI